MSGRRTIAVTGAGGFIGTAVCRQLAAQGDAVYALVGPRDAEIVAPAGIERDVRGSIADPGVLAELLRGGVDAVVHLAGPPSVRASFDDPAGYVHAHTVGTANVLDACRTFAVGRCVYVSSAEVYGRPLRNPVDEDHRLDARSPYAAAKIGAEQLVRAFDHAYGTASTIVRPFSVYGPGMGQHGVIPAILRQLDAADAPRLNDVRPERDFCHVDDIARAIALATRAAHAQTTAINLGSGVGMSIGELARLLLTLVGRAGAVQSDAGTGRPGAADILQLVADRRRAEDVLGWRPAISLEAGLGALVATRTASA